MKNQVTRKRDTYVHGLFALQIVKATINEKTDEVEVVIKVPEQGAEFDRSWEKEYEENSQDQFEMEAFYGGSLPDAFDPGTLEGRTAVGLLSTKRVAGGKLTTAILSIVGNNAVSQAAKRLQAAEGATK